MKVCLNCLAEFRDGCERCSDCGGPLTVMGEADKKMLDKMKKPVKLITLEGEKERQLLMLMLSEENIRCHAVKGDLQSEDIYVEKKRLEAARSVAERLPYEIAEVKALTEAKARMIKPVLLITVKAGDGTDAVDLMEFLEERHIDSYCEREKYYEASRYSGTIGTMSGEYVIYEHIFVDERNFEEARAATEKFLGTFL